MGKRLSNELKCRKEFFQKSKLKRYHFLLCISFSTMSFLYKKFLQTCIKLLRTSGNEILDELQVYTMQRKGNDMLYLLYHRDSMCRISYLSFPNLFLQSQVMTKLQYFVKATLYILISINGFCRTFHMLKIKL